MAAEARREDIRQVAIAWDDVVTTVQPYIVRLSTPGGWGTGFLLAHSPDASVIGIATAAHVVAHAHLWEDPIRVQHPSSGVSIVVRPDVRVIRLDADTDTAVVSLRKSICAIPFPTDTLALAPKGKHLTVGSEIGWLGFPAIPTADLCFFSGRISAWSQSLAAYLVDGNAINGVSGGPAVSVVGPDLFLIGVVTAYAPNRATSETLPGLAMIRSVEQFHADVAAIPSFDQAKAMETSPSAGPNLPPAKPGTRPTKAR
jgi:hypothetical protein